MTPYTDRRNAGHYDDPAKKTSKKAQSTTSANLKGLSTTGGKKTSRTSQ